MPLPAPYPYLGPSYFGLAYFSALFARLTRDAPTVVYPYLGPSYFGPSYFTALFPPASIYVPPSPTGWKSSAARRGPDPDASSATRRSGLEG